MAASFAAQPRADVPAGFGARDVVPGGEPLVVVLAGRRQFPDQRPLELPGARVSAAARRGGARMAARLRGQRARGARDPRSCPHADLFALVDLPDDELRGRHPAAGQGDELPAVAAAPAALAALLPAADAAGDQAARRFGLRHRHLEQPCGRQRCDHRARASCTSATCIRRCATPGTCSTNTCAPPGSSAAALSWAARFVLHRLRQWDVRSANGVDVFVADSAHVARRIRKAYRREAEVAVSAGRRLRFPARESEGDFYLTVSRLEPYKRVDLLVEAFARLPERRLVVIGDGPRDAARLRAMAPPQCRAPRQAADAPRCWTTAARARLPVRRHRGLRHRDGRGAGLRHAADRVRQRRRRRDRPGRHRVLVRRADRGGGD